MALTKWGDFKKEIEKVIKNKKQYFYRGQANAEWKLQTTFHRMVQTKKLSLTLPYYLDKIIPQVNYYISAWHDEIINIDNHNEFGSFLSLLQHYGFPTPLLDWTFSPYIGAYFAFKEVDDENPGRDEVKIFVFDHDNWKTSFQQPINLKQANPFVSVYFPYARYNKRIINQQGVYTITNQIDMAQHIVNCSKKNAFLWEYTFSVKERPLVMRELNLMGINEMTLFPGIEGICRTMSEAFFSKDEVGLTPSELLQKLLNNREPPTYEFNPFQTDIETAIHNNMKTILGSKPKP